MSINCKKLGTPTDRRQFLKSMGVLTVASLAGSSLAFADEKTDASAELQDAAEDPEEDFDRAAYDAATGPIEIVDALGRTIVFDEVPTRVATTIMPSPAIYYSIMGNTDTMVGCNPGSIPAYENSTLRFLWPKLADAATDWVATDFTVNIEECLKLKPDVVFQWTSQPESIEAMEAAGLKVVALKYGGIEDMYFWYDVLGKLFRKTERAKFLMDRFDAEVAEIAEITSQIPEEERPVAIHLYGDLKVGGSGFTPWWMENGGASYPCADLPSSSNEVDMEQILIWNPEYIFIGNFTDIQPSDLFENKLKGQDWSVIPAVKNGNVYKIPIGGYRWDPPNTESCGSLPAATRVM